MIRFRRGSGFSSEELSKLMAAQVVVNLVMGSDKFRKKVLESRFTVTNDSSPEIIARMSQGWLIHIKLVSPPFWSRWFSRVFAHECADGGLVLWRDEYSRQSVAELVNVIVHEACHVAGYRHLSAEDMNSVPYALGNLSQKIALEMIAENMVPEHLEAVTSTNS